MIKKTKGFTLVETILVVGIIAIIGAGIYSTYVKKYNNFMVERQSQYVVQILKQLEQSLIILSDNPANVSISTAAIESAVNPPTNLISSNIIPEEMKLTTTTVNNLWGGKVTFAGINSGIALFQMTFEGIPKEACAKFITNSLFINISQILQVNGIQVKSLGASVVDSTAAANACNLVTNNIVKISSDISKHGIDPISQTGAKGYYRTKETKYNISTAFAGTTSTSPTCGSGASWNTITTTCECPSGQSWNGISCIPFGSSTTGTLAGVQGFAGNCPLGQGWNLTFLRCDPLTSGTGGAVSGTTVAGREVPNNIWDATTQSPDLSTLTQRPTSNTNNCPLGPAPLTSRPSNNGGGTYDGKICQVCIVGTWNGDRCVTP